MERDGNREDGWDAIEHAIAEYPIREGAVPIFILIETEGPRIEVNATLTHEGTLAALASKNAILNVVTPAPFDIFGITPTETLGVVADTADGVLDQQHDVYVLNGASYTIGAYDDASPFDQVPSQAEDEYVRLAWQTGGAAWNLDAFNGGLNSDSTLALNEAIADSIVAQIQLASASGEVYRTPRLVAGVNFGGAAFTDWQSYTSGGVSATSGLANYTGYTNAVSPSITSAATTSLRASAAGTSLNVSVTQDNMGQPLADGKYLVELYFFPYSLSEANAKFDVTVEGGPALLKDFVMAEDRGTRINWAPGTPEQYRVAPNVNGSSSAISVKRYEVVVQGGNGLQLELAYKSGGRPSIAGMRVLQELITGDYNRDGVVDTLDYGFWAASYALTVVPGAGADGNLDGVVNAADYNVWRDNWNGVMTWSTALSPLNYGLANAGSGAVMADYNGNGVVDYADYELWLSTFGSTTNLLADGNDDGIVDELDYGLWLDTFGSTSANPRFGLLAGALAGDVAPSVVGFALGNGGSGVHDFTTTVGSGEQVRSIPLAATNRLSVTFSEDVVVKQADLQLYNLDGATPTVTGFDYDVAAQTATWTFSSSLADGRYLATLSDAVYGDGDNYKLDGDFLNPWSLSDATAGVFPTGDGDAGGVFRFHFTVLSGDSNHDNLDGATNYTNWHSTEPGAIYVSKLTDEFDIDLSFGDLSLREAINYANNSLTPVTVYLPVGRIMITRAGSSELDASHDIRYNDLNIFSDVRVVGAGPGLSVIDLSGLSVNAHRRAFDVASGGNSLEIRGVTIANGAAYYAYEGVAAKVGAGSSLTIKDSAIVNNLNLQYGTGVYSVGGDLTVLRTVFTNNESVYQGGQAIHAIPDGATMGSLTIGESVFALNRDRTPSGPDDPNVLVAAGVALTNRGKNLFDDATGGFFDTTPGVGDYLGVADYVVTTIADTFDPTNNLESLSVREAIDLANQAAGSDEIWMPAWRFTLTRDRQTYGGSSPTDTDVAFGDLDVTGPLTIRGIADRTRIEWKPGVVDAVFDLLGDYNDDGLVDTADDAVWASENNSGSGTSTDWELYAADGDDDGEVDAADHTIWSTHYGSSLDLFDVAVL